MPFKKSEETFCVRDRYTKSATSFIQCKKIIKTVVFSEKLTNIERQSFFILPLFQLFKLFITIRLDIALYKYTCIEYITLM